MEIEVSENSKSLAVMTPVSGRTIVAASPARANGKRRTSAKPKAHNDAHDIHPEQDGLQRSLSATIALLKKANDMLEEAEQTILDQEARIARLEMMASRDDLTGLLNRRGFFDAFMSELDRCNRSLSQGGLLVMIDLDNFKAINDTHGHLAGDAALRLVGRTLASEIRAMDSAARLGGDEFVLLLSHTTKRELASRAQTLGWKLNNLSLAWHGDLIPVRASLGLKAYKAGDKPETVFNAADEGLYAQKEAKKQNWGSQQDMNE